MPMSYQAFKDHLTKFLWRNNDQDLIGSLDALVSMANAELTRAMHVEDRHMQVSLPITDLDTTLPSDYHSMRSVACTDTSQYYTGEFTYIKPAELLARRSYGQDAWQNVYSLRGRTLLLAGPLDVSDPITLSIEYQTKVPDFQEDDESWLADEQLDLYTYAVLKHTAPFLREDERVQLWVQLYNDALASYIEDSAFWQTRGTSASMPLPRAAGVNRKGDRRTTSNPVR